ncbi:hypothetical protein [Pantoea allii]|uniref:hypothetical protein n=1 Tax=Pantoea allii TaxID=574096 RepID=UPI003D31762E
MGYLGSPLMSYFFIHLKEKKRVFFLEKGNSAYNFPHEIENRKAINRLKPLYYTYLVGFLSCFLLAAIAILIKINAI